MIAVTTAAAKSTRIAVITLRTGSDSPASGINGMTAGIHLDRRTSALPPAQNENGIDTIIQNVNSATRRGRAADMMSTKRPPKSTKSTITVDMTAGRCADGIM